MSDSSDCASPHSAPHRRHRHASDSSFTSSWASSSRRPVPGDLQRKKYCVSVRSVDTKGGAWRTWWQALAELLSLLRVVEGKSVEVAGAPDFELGLDLAASDPWRDLLYPRLCRHPKQHQEQFQRRKIRRDTQTKVPLASGRSNSKVDAPVASFLVAISMKRLMSRTSLG